LLSLADGLKGLSPFLSKFCIRKIKVVFFWPCGQFNLFAFQYNSHDVGRRQKLLQNGQLCIALLEVGEAAVL
jgi:hypothetical protein